MNEESEQKFDESAYLQFEEFNRFDYSMLSTIAWLEDDTRMWLCAGVRQRHAALHFSLADERRTALSLHICTINSRSFVD